jgi:hypothetical protein
MLALLLVLDAGVSICMSGERMVCDFAGLYSDPDALRSTLDVDGGVWSE